MSFERGNQVHQFIILAAAAASQQQSPPIHAPEEAIVVTASREPVVAAEAGVSATVFDKEMIDALALPMTSDVLRLSPGLAIATSGTRGTLTDVRIRGAEANHSLLFVDGIRFNDPAAGNTARFELLSNDALSRIEVVRGPQSALWGSDAIGGVIAIETADAAQGSAFSALGEYGSLDSARASAQAAVRTGALSLSGSAGFLRSDGIDIFSEAGERDGFKNRSASAKAVLRLSSSIEAGVVGHWVDGTSEFDGFDATSFAFADTLDATDNRIFALRGWTKAELAGWTLSAATSYLDSENRNRVGATPVNDTFGERLTLGAQASRSFGRHCLTAAIEREEEDFRGRGYFGSSDQDRSRGLTALVGQWRAEWTGTLTTDLAVRHDDFSEFANATTVRALLLFKPRADISLHGAYSEGVSRPTFYDLFGFFPGSFIGNPTLRPEHSRGFEAGIRWSAGPASIGVTGFSNRLEDEIVDIFNPDFTSTTANAPGKSRRRGVELDMGYRIGAFQLSGNYTYLDAEERRNVGGAPVREARRPRHSANLLGAGRFGPFELGGSLAYVGKRRDAAFPADAKLNDYLLGSLKLGYRITPSLEAYARVENAFDADYQDAFGYNTPGRTVYAGLRIRLGN
jgi:vitamin B12 transporter